MLGCHDFCGYYEWTFHYVRRRWGQAAFALLMRESIAEDSQQHYATAASGSVLRALYNSWVKTGQDEHCDWTWTLDEEKNVLRWDMRECPSKGFLVQNDLNADEDYCNHCMGWVIPMMEGLGGEVVEHEHNHCGQCFGVMRMKDRPSQPLHLDVDIRNDPRWKRGFFDRWAHSQPLPPMPSTSPSSDPCAVLESFFREVEAVTLLDDSAGSKAAVASLPTHVLLAADAAYNDRRKCALEPSAVLIGCPPADLAATAARYNATPAADRPLLLHAFLPGVPFADFVSAGLPRPLPILPLLIRNGLYIHRPGGLHPTTGEFLRWFVTALGKRACESFASRT